MAGLELGREEDGGERRGRTGRPRAVPYAQRGRREREQAALDEQWLRWVTRFRFVTADRLAEHFRVSWGARTAARAA